MAVRWDTKVVIWSRWALGETIEATLNYLQRLKTGGEQESEGKGEQGPKSKEEQRFQIKEEKRRKRQEIHPDAPVDRNTVSKIRKEFKSLRPELIKLAIQEQPVIMMLVENEKKCPGLKAKLDEFEDGQILERIARVLDRPAFTTPFRQEFCMPHFEQAISDTIEALNTGVYRIRDGMLVERIPTRHDLNGAQAKRTMEEIVYKLVELRDAYKTHRQKGGIRELNRNRGICLYLISSEAASDMDTLRHKILADFRRIYPRFSA